LLCLFSAHRAGDAVEGHTQCGIRRSAQRKVRGRVHLTNSDRLFFIQLYRWFPSVLKAVTIIRPETIVRWHRAGFWPAPGSEAGWLGESLSGST